MNLYGEELIIDLSNCDVTQFTREKITLFFDQMCKLLDMEKALVSPYFWDEENGGESDEPHLKGVSAIQFIETSNITIHTLTLLRVAMLNIFSCKEFDANKAVEFSMKFFEAQKAKHSVVKREYSDPRKDN